MSPDHRSDPIYVKLADTLREQITTGHVPPGTLLPSSAAISERHHVGLMTVQRALRLLASEGLIDTRRGTPAKVRAQPDRATIPLALGDRLIARMPTRREARDHGLPAGVPLLEIHHPTGTITTVRADRHNITA
ncbi:winged helix-turn-helix domain-containing protein [Dactylosporangium sp. NPDC051484]|uniref:GntR family transcriptional regulator n=1 Tax=Dactylosporangium sp. NPDC051484 TaxID=3154942 RepID=UPI00344C4C0E